MAISRDQAENAPHPLHFHFKTKLFLLPALMCRTIRSDKMKHQPILFFLIILFGACNHHPLANRRPGADSPLSVVKHDSIKTASAKRIQGIVFSAKKDLSCGMPLTAGVEDTATYKGKTYGFCSRECKEDFLKNPEVYIKIKDRIN